MSDDWQPAALIAIAAYSYDKSGSALRDLAREALAALPPLDAKEPT